MLISFMECGQGLLEIASFRLQLYENNDLLIQKS